MSLHPHPPAPHTITLTVPPGAPPCVLHTGMTGLAVPGGTRLPWGLCIEHSAYLERFPRISEGLVPSPSFRFNGNVLSEAPPFTSYITVQISGSTRAETASTLPRTHRT